MSDAMPDLHPPALHDTNGGTAQPTPYYVQASCELSEDYFLTADVLIGPGDKIVPFTRGGSVEAIVLAGQQIFYLRRDASTTSGWAYEQFDDDEGSPVVDVADVAVSTDSTGKPWMMYLTYGSDGHYVPDTWWCDPATGEWSQYGGPVTLDIPGMVRSGVTPAGNPYFYWWGPQGTGTQIDAWEPAPHPPVSLLEVAGTDVTNIVVLWDPEQPSGQDAQGWVLALASNGALSLWSQTGPQSYHPTPFTWDGHVSALVWAGYPIEPGIHLSAPEVVWQDTSGTLHYINAATSTSDLPMTFGDPIGAGQTAVWQSAGLYTFAFLSQGLLQLTAEYSESNGVSLFTDAIPLVGGVSQIYGFPADPAQSTIFAVFADTTLNVLTKDPVLGWTQTQVHQQNATLQEVQSWRVQISILDANNAGVADGQATVATDRLVGLWQPSGNTILEPGGTVTMTADYSGQITVTIPAGELDTAVLTVQALDGGGHSTGSPFTVTPDTDVQNFLAGRGSLTDTGMLSGTSLLAAKTSTGATVFPGLASAANPAAGASQVALALNHVASLGLGYQPEASTDVRSASFDLTGATPSFQTSTDPNGFPVDIQALNAQRSLGSVSDWWHSVEHDAESVFHGLRHGAIAFKKMISSWDQDAKQWTVNLIVDIGDGLDNLMTYVISDITTAVHAISSFFHALGADIKAGLDWLKHHVIALLKEAEANAKMIEGWFRQAIGTTAAPGPFVQVINNLDVSTEGFFDHLAAEAHQAISQIETAVEDVTFGSAAPLPPPTTNTGSNDANLVLRDVGQFAKFLRHCSGNWLLDKILHHLPADDPGPGTVPAFTALIDQLATNFVDVITFADSTWKLLETSLVDVNSPAAFSQTEMTTWFGVLDKTVNSVVALLEAIAETVIDVMKVALEWMLDTLDYQIPILPADFQYTLIGQIFKLAGIDLTISVSHLVSLVAAYPATLINALHGTGPLFPATTSDAADEDRMVGDSGDAWLEGLGFTAAVVQGIWGFNDIIVDLQTANEDGTVSKAPSFCDWIDIFAPIILCIVQWPSAQEDGHTGPPFYGFIDTSTSYDWMLPFIIVSGISPSLMALVQKRCEATAGTNQPPPDSGVTDPLADYYGPIVQMICGIVNTALGTTFNVKTDADSSAIAGGVLGNVSYMLAVFMQKWANAESGDIPVLLKTLFDAAGNVGAAVCIAEATTLPPR